MVPKAVERAEHIFKSLVPMDHHFSEVQKSMTGDMEIECACRPQYLPSQPALTHFYECMVGEGYAIHFLLDPKLAIHKIAVVYP